MTRPLLIALVLTLAVAAPAAGATKNVKVGDDYFVRKGSPPTVTVTKGTTVKWNWRGSRRHNVVVTSGPVRFQSALKRSGSYSKKMRRAGTYKIVCSIHAPDMAMTLKVKRRS
jgi:plastocyanin